jgi:hypothetical protein
MTVSDQLIMAYVDGELDAGTAAALEAAIATDVELQARVEQQQTLRRRLGAAFADVLDEPVPARLTAALAADVRRTSGRRHGGQLHGAKRGAWMQWGALAASLVLGAFLTTLATPLFSKGLITDENGKVRATGPLAQALSTQSSGADSSRKIQIQLSFLGRNGQYCRVFHANATSPLGGLACQSAGRWDVVLLERAPGTASDNYRQAATSLSPAILSRVTDLMVAGPLDARQEAAALSARWKR